MAHVKINTRCLTGGCEGWDRVKDRQAFEAVYCPTCGLYPPEAKRRQEIPLTRGPGGLRRKVIRRTNDGREES